MQIGKVKVCIPITELVSQLKSLGLAIVEEKVSDFHFHEVAIKMTQSKSKEKDFNINLDKIEKINSNLFRCECHWSTVSIDEEKSE